MTIEQLIYFKTIVEKKTYSEAAMYLNLSQSSLSKHIIKLENEIEVELFDRSKRQIVLTEGGKQFYQDVQNVLDAYNRMMSHVKERKKPNENEINIAMFPFQAQYGFGEKLKQFRMKHPEVTIRIKEIEERDFDAQFINDDFDILILRGEWKDMVNFTPIPTYHDQLVAIVSDKNPLSKKSIIDIKELKHEKILLLPEYTRIRHICEEACNKAGFEANVVRYARHDTILNAAKDNDGVALVMETSLKLYQLQAIKVLNFKEPIVSEIYLYFSSKVRKNKTVNDLVQCFKEKGN